MIRQTDNGRYILVTLLDKKDNRRCPPMGVVFSSEGPGIAGTTVRPSVDAGLQQDCRSTDNKRPDVSPTNRPKCGHCHARPTLFLRRSLKQQLRRPWRMLHYAGGCPQTNCESRCFSTAPLVLPSKRKRKLRRRFWNDPVKKAPLERIRKSNGSLKKETQTGSIRLAPQNHLLCPRNVHKSTESLEQVCSKPFQWNASDFV